jgi:putative endonuclease
MINKFKPQINTMHHNKLTGNKGEEMAAVYLKANGYEILESNWRYGHWEVDIIAAKGKMLYFFEIKTRTSDRFGHPEESISKKKMQNLRNAAEQYQELYPQWKYLQFNVLAITIKFGKPAEYFMLEDVYF